MVRGATNSNVSNIDVVVERPADRDRLNDAVRSNDATESISGSEATGVLVTNNSAGAWYLEAVSVSALGVTTPGVVVVDVAIRNSNDTVLVDQTIDITESQVDFGGVIVKPDWDVHYTINQSDTNSYNVVIRPLLRKPQPGTFTGSPGSGGNGEADDTIDSFEDGDLSEYSGDTANFSVVSTDSYHLDNALECTNGSDQEIHAASGLENHPEQGDTFKWNQKSTARGGGSGSEMQTAVEFNLTDSDNTWIVRSDYEQGAIRLLEEESGSVTVVDSYFPGSLLKADEWHEGQVSWGSDTIDITMWDPAGEEIASLSVATADLSLSGNQTGWGWRGRANVGGEAVRMDNARIL